MTSTHTSPSTPTEADPDALRAELKPAGPVGGYVDGAWWPHSRVLATELPALFTLAADRVGPVARVAFHLDDWDADAPRKLHNHAMRVPLEGFHATDPHLLALTGRSGRRLLLLVIPPDTAPDTAQRALHDAAESGNVQSTKALLG
jgi:hypothetical protein